MLHFFIHPIQLSKLNSLKKWSHEWQPWHDESISSWIMRISRKRSLSCPPNKLINMHNAHTSNNKRSLGLKKSQRCHIQLPKSHIYGNEAGGWPRLHATATTNANYPSSNISMFLTPLITKDHSTSHQGAKNSRSQATKPVATTCHCHH